MLNKKLFALGAIAMICFSITGCGDKSDNNDDSDAIILNVYNCADYMAETETVDGETIKGVVDLFEEHCKNNLNKNVKVNYSTYETNEDMYNQLKAGGVQYDLVCPSEYMIEKMLINDMLEKIPSDKQIENYNSFASPYIKETFNDLKTNVDENTYSFKDYAIPYMWGTMGFMYNPKKVKLEDVSTWDIIWNKDYKNKVSLKDSIRDTYITATLHIYKEELLLAKQTLSDDDYKQKVSDIMNRCDDLTISLVETALKQAKENIYEFEVDTGKENIIKGKYDVNLCWSGDAVWSLNEAQEQEDGMLLNYKVPEEGSNVWFDAWVMPKGANVDLATDFLNFLCKPEIAAMNMDYIGYTSAIAGQEIWDLVNDKYNDSEGTINYDLTYFFKNTGISSQDGKFIVKTKEANRQLFAQYPDEETIKRCAVMKDFKEQNDKVSEMWISVKGNSASWVIFVFLGVIVVFVVMFEVKNAYNKRARKNRNKAR